jgi:hypothetical protein
MIELKAFVSKIPDFSSIGAGNQIKYFVYFMQVEKNSEIIKTKDVADCFENLHINPYSNISSYLSNYSKKGKTQQFLKRGSGYILFAAVRTEIDKQLEKPVEIQASNSLYPISIFDNTKGYLIQFAKEASSCYDLGLYNSCLFMLRKITETLIIELYESKEIESKIKNANNDYFQLSELIKAVTNEPSWKLTKIVKENLPKIKLLADSSVHSKRFSAKKPDLDGLKTNLRIGLEELISHIDYAKWNAKQ